MSKSRIYGTQLRETVMGEAYYGSAFIMPLSLNDGLLSHEDKLCLLRYQMGLNTIEDLDTALDIADKLSY
jgi:hypothetical protein